MSVLESIVRNLRGLPTHKLVDVAHYVHQLRETAEKERAEGLRETHGYLDEKEALIFEQALQSSRSTEPRG